MYKLQPNTTQIPNIFFDVLMCNLTDTELRVLLFIARQTYGWIEDPITKKRKDKDWISYSQLIEKTGRQSQAIAQALKGLREKNLIEVLDQSGILIKTKQEALGKKLFYRIKTSLKIKEVKNTISNPTNLFENQNLIIKDTKETYTKIDFTKVKSVKNKSSPSNGCKNPEGHQACMDNLKYIDETYHKRLLLNRKNFKFQEMLYVAGATDDLILKIIQGLVTEPFYIKNGWDMSTVYLKFINGGNYGPAG